MNHADVHHKQEEVGELDRDIMARVQRALCGIDSVGVYSRPRRMQPHHLDVARRVFSTLNGGAFVPLDTSHIELLQDVFSHPEAARIM